MTGQAPAAQTQDGKRTETLDDRLGTDDGAAAALLISANQRGNLDLCDCNHPRGGLARHVGYTRAFKTRFKDTPVVQVDAGFLFYTAQGYPKFAMLQNDQVVRAYSRWPLDVVNLGRFDLFYAQKLFEREGLQGRLAESPLLKNIISANGVFEPGTTPPPAFLVKEVTGPRIKTHGGRLRIAFVGVAEPVHVSEGLDGMVTDMFKAARQVVPEAKKNADIVVLVSHAEWKAATRLAQENPEADVVIAGNAEGFFDPEKVGNVLLVVAAPGNVKLGVLGIYLDSKGRASFKYRMTELDEIIPADPDALKFANAAQAERQRR